MGKKRSNLIMISPPPALMLMVAFTTVLLFSMHMESAEAQGQRKGNNLDAASTHYITLTPVRSTGQERVFCLARGRCFLKLLTCPVQCTQRKPRRNKKVKGCFVDCSSKCETTCKFRKANCNGFGSVCYDPRFVGGDGVMFYFHGAKGQNFALVSDDHLHINAHFIGTRPTGRTRDYTWVQALALKFDHSGHTLVLAADRVAKWDDARDALLLRWDGRNVTVPADGEAEWRIRTEEGREVTVERTDDANSVRVTVSGLVQMDVRVAPVGAEENRVHNYQLPEDDAFAHLETQFKFYNLTEKVEGVLGQTYRPGYVSPVKTGVPMPIMGGEDRYKTPALLSSYCASCRFRGSQRSTGTVVTEVLDVDAMNGVALLQAA
ncbi:hypothetical protein H6P81_011672 [Aristolochia fimbriata]|uniref:Uncharacterized protein n=1 Tax=Aristolochia fimbriata TaxID=158543 RepID=A0AAV7EA83_ARIFI|nr:hypothetical protein H6P81_011672 [Aristolochia fimbriata]